jgi:hypothetical protein
MERAWRVKRPRRHVRTMPEEQRIRDAYAAFGIAPPRRERRSVTRQTLTWSDEGRYVSLNV